MSITLTTPPSILTVLGGSTLATYDHVVLSPMTLSPTDLTINASVRLTSSADPEMDVVNGSVSINGSSGQLIFTVSQLDMIRKMQLTGGQITAVLGIISDAQDALESGLITVGAIDGTQSTGA